jgi:hypothetical protein
MEGHTTHEETKMTTTTHPRETGRDEEKARFEEMMERIERERERRFEEARK